MSNIKSQHDNLYQWGNSIIEKVKADKGMFSSTPLEFSIFYSPLVNEPNLMIIGDNPGGQLNEPGLYEIPLIHEYCNQDYQLAVAMREKVLLGEKLNKILENSVKLNRIFFRTPDLRTLNQFNKVNEIKLYCKLLLAEIISRINPKTILAESFGTFRALSYQETSILKNPLNGKDLLLSGEYKGINLYGINHPTGSRGVTSEDWAKVNKKLEELL